MQVEIIIPRCLVKYKRVKEKIILDICSRRFAVEECFIFFIPFKYPFKTSDIPVNGNKGIEQRIGKKRFFSFNQLFKRGYSNRSKKVIDIIDIIKASFKDFKTSFFGEYSLDTIASGINLVSVVFKEKAEKLINNKIVGIPKEYRLIPDGPRNLVINILLIKPNSLTNRLIIKIQSVVIKKVFCLNLFKIVFISPPIIIFYAEE